MSNVMRGRRHALGMSQAHLAELVGVTSRQIARYEAGDQQPVLTVAAAIARALEISLMELAGEFESSIDLSGNWWSAWEHVEQGERTVTVQELQAIQHNKTIRLTADQAGVANRGIRGWIGELRLWENEVLLGSYQLTAEPFRSRGTVFLAVQAGHDQVSGRWVGQSPDGEVITGEVWLARERQQAERLAHQSP